MSVKPVPVDRGAVAEVLRGECLLCPRPAAEAFGWGLDDGAGLGIPGRPVGAIVSLCHRHFRRRRRHAAEIERAIVARIRQETGFLPVRN